LDSQNDTYIKFVMESIAQYKKYSDRLTRSDKELDPCDMQFILTRYHSAKLGLLAEMSRKRRIFKLLDRSFKLWWNSCLLASKEKLTIPGKKYPAVKDYTVQAEEDNKDVYSQKQEELQEAEEEYEFLKLLKEDWNSFQFTLQTLNDNMKSEMRSLSLDNSEMFTEEKPKTRRIKND